MTAGGGQVYSCSIVFDCAIFDVRTFNPRAQSNKFHSQSASQRHKLEKRQTYQQVFEVEMPFFTQLISSASDSLDPAAATTFERLASLLTTKWRMAYATIIGWLRCQPSFALLSSSIMLLRGFQHVRGTVGTPRPAVAKG